jgi:hypothetical protein
MRVFTASFLLLLAGSVQGFIGVNMVKNGARMSALAAASICPEVPMQAQPGREIAVVAMG